MKIVIVGNGKVGFSLAEQLSQEAHDVTVVDTDEQSLRRAADALDVMTVKGNGVSALVLRDAGAAEADLLVACTNQDEVNMVCCLTAKNMGAQYTIARIRNPEYASGFDQMRQDMGIDMIINPEYASAVEISRLLRFPSAADIDTFCRGRVELIGVRLQEGDFVVGAPLYALPDRVKKLSMLFCAVERGEDMVIPNGGFAPQAGDKLYLIGQPDSLDQFLKLLGRSTSKPKNVMILGGGKISVYLAGKLLQMKMKVKLIELREDKCRTISENLPNVTVICGDGTDQELLEVENLSAFDAFVSLSDRDEDNLIIALYAAQRGLPKVVAKCNRQNYTSIANSVGLESIISPKLITAENILQVVRGMQNSHGSVMNALYRIADGKAEAMEFIVSPSTQNLGVPLKDLRLKPGILIAVVVRKGKIIIPEGSTSIQEKDSVILISRNSGILDLNDIYAGTDQSPAGTGGKA